MKLSSLSLISSGVVLAQGRQPTVSAPAGVFTGNASIAQLDQFLGIPYAQPPIESLRLANPLPLDADGSDKIEATAYGPGCPQFEDYAQYNGLSEDCLTLNVVRPASCSDHSEPLPVMFWIHGGGNANGQSIFYNGTALVQHSIAIGQPVVYVGINYRLGGFGFLNSPAVQEAGVTNLGLKDQYLALQWAHDNIAAFGGDPDKVTIFGESAGAADCWAQLHYAYKNNETNTYFRGMITQSGAPGSPAYPLALSAEEGADLYAQVIAETNCSAGGLDCLRTLSYEDIAPILVNVSSADFAIDGDWFDADLASLVESGQFSAMPIIHGSNLNEGVVFMPDAFDYPDRDDLIEAVAEWIDDDTAAAEKIVDAYFASSDEALGKGVLGDPTADHGFWVAQAVYSDLRMDLGKQTWLHMASTKSQAWGYDLRQQPPLAALNLSYEYPGNSQEYARRVGVFHGAELPYVFGEATSLKNRTQGDDDVSIAIMDAWIEFAYCLDPNGVKGRRILCNASHKWLLTSTQARMAYLTGRRSTQVKSVSSWSSRNKPVWNRESCKTRCGRMSTTSGQKCFPNRVARLPFEH